MFEPNYIIVSGSKKNRQIQTRIKYRTKNHPKDEIGLLGTSRRELGHRFGSFGDGVLGKFTREDETNGSLYLS
jgi:hypothetical protein